jgi:hypothetical protein
LGVSDWDTATADLTVEEAVTVELTWESTGTDRVDYGAVLPGSAVNDALFLHVLHNLG